MKRLLNALALGLILAAPALAQEAPPAGSPTPVVLSPSAGAPFVLSLANHASRPASDLVAELDRFTTLADEAGLKALGAKCQPEFLAFTAQGADIQVYGYLTCYPVQAGVKVDPWKVSGFIKSELSQAFGTPIGSDPPQPAPGGGSVHN